MYKRFDFKLSRQLAVFPYEARLLRYLHSNQDGLSFTQAVIEAVQVFWMPFAIRWRQGNTFALSPCARRALYRLEQRKIALPQLWEVPDPDWHCTKLVSASTEAQFLRGQQTQFKVDLRLQVQRDSDMHQLLQYMKAEPDGLSMQEMILSACSGYWICPTSSIEDLRQNVVRAISRLDLQLAYLCNEFGVTLSLPEAKLLLENELETHQESSISPEPWPAPRPEDAQIIDNLFS